MSNNDNVLSVGAAIALGDLLSAIQRKSKVKWMDGTGAIRNGELRSLVVGPDSFAFAPWGTDVREMWVWVTTSVTETTFSVWAGMEMLQNGGMIFE